VIKINRKISGIAAQAYTTRTHFSDRDFCCTAPTVFNSLSNDVVSSTSHSYSVRIIGLVGSHDHNLSVNASGVFDILPLYELDYYYYHINVQVTLSLLLSTKVGPRGWMRMSTKVDNKGQSAAMSCMCRQ